MILVSEEIARLVLRRAEHDPAVAFVAFAPYECKLCGEPPTTSQRMHLATHRRELDRLSQRRREAALRKAQAARRENVRG